MIEFRPVTEPSPYSITTPDLIPFAYLADNFQRFIRLVFSVPHAEMLEQLSTISNKEQEKAILDEFIANLPFSWKIKQEKVFLH